MLGGYMGKILLVDLTAGTFVEEKLPEELYREFVGSSGLGARILYDRLPAKADPLGPDNILGFVTGPVTGTTIPQSARYMVITKSPLTGAITDSNSGGYFGPELKATGYDGLFIKGISPRPVYLVIRDGQAELKDAAHLWGKDTSEAEDILRSELGDKGFHFAGIGVAGEKLSLMAAVINDKGRTAARSGVGAVMGSKRLKAIALKGSQKVPVADTAKLEELRKTFWTNLQAGGFIQGLIKHGTCGSLSALVVSGGASVKNWSLHGEQALPTHAKLTGDNITKYQARRYACKGCPVACGGIVNITEGPYQVKEAHKPEYETLAAFGSQCFNDNVESVVKANDLCNLFGLDTISAGETLGFAMECYEKGLIKNKDTDGIELTWGNSDAMLAMLDKIGRREGFGDVLADGVRKAAQKIGQGSEEFAMHIMGQEPGCHDPRLLPARGTLYLVDPTPGRHTIGTLTTVLERGGSISPYPLMQMPKPVIQGDYNNKGFMYATGTDFFEIMNASGMCMFSAFAAGGAPLADFIATVTGWDFTIAEGLRAGRRVQTQRQALNVKQGVLPEHYRLPKRLSEPAETGPFAGVKVDFDALRAGYFAAMGWDMHTGKPYKRTLLELHLDNVAKDFWG